MNRSQRRKAARQQTSPVRPSAAAQRPLVVPTTCAATAGQDVDHAARLRRLAERRSALEVELGDAVRDAVAAGLSQAAVGRLLGVTRQSVWERVHRA